MLDIIVLALSRFGQDVTSSCTLAAVGGLLSHLLYFIRGWRDHQALGIAGFHLAAAALLLLRTVTSLGLAAGLVAYVAVSAAYLAALFASMAVYRLFFHRLARFPGPFVAKLTKLYGPWANRDWRMHEEFQRLHDRYGPFLRTGPSELCILSLDALVKVHARSGTSKFHTGIYDALVFMGERNLDAMTDHDVHRERRKIWDKSFNTAALESYESSIRIVARSWLAKLASLDGKPINTTLFAKLIPFDNMGRVGFSANFGTIEAGKEARILDLLEVTTSLIARLGFVSWPLFVLMGLPSTGMKREFEELAIRMADDREKLDGDGVRDIMSAFLDDMNSEKPKSFFNRNILYSDSQAVIIGATDTVACTLGYVFYYLARDASVRENIRSLLAPVFGKTQPGEFSNADLQTIKYLDAFIDETLRLHPPAATTSVRQTPSEGFEIDGVFVPGDVNVFTMAWVYHRSPKYWSQPDEFIPERFTTRPDLILDKRAFMPFLMGRYDCVGKRLAQALLRLTIAYTIWYYDLEFAPGEDPQRIITEARNQGIMKPGPLYCVFTKRVET